MVATETQLNQMHPQMRKPYIEYDRRMAEKKIAYMITSVGRLSKQQFALYAQGRNDIKIVNMYRKLAGMGPIKPEDNKIVTWTLNSEHIIDLDDGNPDNDFSRAIDIAILKGVKNPTWDLKINVNQNDIPDYEESAAIAKAVGFVAGFYWKKKDPPHIQFPIKRSAVV